VANTESLKMYIKKRRKPMAADVQQIRDLLADVRKQLMKKTNVVATGIGYKTTQGKKTNQLCIICGVQEKRAETRLTKKELIPAQIQGVVTDVYPTGIIYAQVDHKARFRPAPGGVSIGHRYITAGTLGCLVKKHDTVYILSNNHVLANTNEAEINDIILQPGLFDGGSSDKNHLARLSEFVPITFDGAKSSCFLGRAAASLLNGISFLTGSRTRLIPVRKAAGENLVDAALAQPINGNDVKNEILQIGAVSGVAEAHLGMAIKKSGRTTGYTTGVIQQVDATVKVNYGENKNAIFVDQLIAGTMSQGGDSGSAVLNNKNKLIGLLFAGSNNSTIINRIQNVFQLLEISLP
jgi:S1-C subfamily serine protease